MDPKGEYRLDFPITQTKNVAKAEVVESNLPVSPLLIDLSRPVRIPRNVLENLIYSGLVNFCLLDIFFLVFEQMTRRVIGPGAELHISISTNHWEKKNQKRTGTRKWIL